MVSHKSRIYGAAWAHIRIFPPNDKRCTYSIRRVLYLCVCLCSQFNDGEKRRHSRTEHVIPFLCDAFTFCVTTHRIQRDCCVRWWFSFGRMVLFVCSCSLWQTCAIVCRRCTRAHLCGSIAFMALCVRYVPMCRTISFVNYHSQSAATIHTPHTNPSLCFVHKHRSTRWTTAHKLSLSATTAASVFCVCVVICLARVCMYAQFCSIGIITGTHEHDTWYTLELHNPAHNPVRS